MENSRPYTIRLFVPDGDPSSIKVIDKMNWTGVGLEIDRSKWKTHNGRPELLQAGIYILVGSDEDTELPKVYIGQGDGVRGRIESHYKDKDFWDKVFVFVSSNGGLNRAHITWLEWALIERAHKAKRCTLDNNATPKEPILTEFEKADTREFLQEMLSILPLVDVRVFEKPKVIDVQMPKRISDAIDTVVVPAQEDGFKTVFLNEHKWYAIRIGGGNLNRIKYLATYRTSPISAITHYAEVESIEEYGDSGKYLLNLKAPVEVPRIIEFGNAKSGSMQGPRYTSLKRLLDSSSLKELFE